MASRSNRLRIVCGLLFVASLYGCATVVSKGAHPAAPRTPAARTLDLSILASGMTMKEVQRREPPPHAVFTMTSGAVTVVKWVYENRGAQAVLYFTNGILESWTP